MSKWVKTARWICIACVLGAAVNLFAQGDHLIENQRTNIIINTEWGDTYLGKYTPDNALIVSSNATLTSANAFIGVSDLATSNTALVAAGGTWTMDSLQIGSISNAGNTATVQDGGTIEIDTSLSILGTTNGNMFMLGSGGTLDMKSDFNAIMDGFVYGSNNTLKVGGELSNLDHVENQRTLVLRGENAAWNRTTNIVFIGDNTSGNSLSLDGAQLSFTNISIGSIATANNAFMVSSGAQATVASNLSLKGIASSVEVSGSQLQVAGNIDVVGDASYIGIKSGSQLEADGNLLVNGVSNYIEVSGSQLQVAGNIDVVGDASYIGINGGYLAANGNLNSENNVQFSGEGDLLALGNVEMPGIDGSGLMILSGENARWTNNTSLQIGATQGGSMLAIEDNALVRTDTIEVGSVSNSSSSVVMGDKGKLILDGVGSVLNSGSLLIVDDGGWLTFGSDFSTALTWTDTNIIWNTGGTIEFQGEAPVISRWEVLGEYVEEGTLFLGEGRTMILNGSTAYLPAHTNNFHLGDLSSDNNFVVTNGARASFKTVSIGDFKEGGNNNTLLVSGNNSVVTNLGFTAIGGTMIANTWHEGGTDNILRVEGGALFYSPDTLHNRNTTGTSGLEIASGALVDVNNYYQSSGALLTLFADSSGTNTGLLRADTAEFEAGARVGVDSISALPFNQMYTNLIVEANDLIIDGITNGTTADLAKLGTSGGTLLTYDLVLENGTDIIAMYERRSISEAGGFDPDTLLKEISDEIERLASENTAASNQLAIIENMGSDQQVKLQMEQMYVYQLPTYMHNQGVFGGIDQVRARGLSAQEPARMKTRSKPKGPSGPHAEDQGLQGWAKVYGNFGSRDKDDGSGFVDGYDAQTYGTVIGFDQAFNDWLFGLAGGYAGSTLDGENGDKSDATTGYGILYANYGTKDWFGDLVLSYGLTDIDNTSGTDFGVTSSTKASQSAFYIGGGYQFEDKPSGALLRPMLGLQVSMYDQDAYTESGNVLVKDVDAYDRWSSQSSLGASVIYPKAGKKMDMELQLRAFWLHEFNGDEEQVGYTLVDSGLRGQFVLRSPDQDVAQLGLGYVTKGKNGWQLRADIDLQLSETYASTTLSGALLYEF